MFYPPRNATSPPFRPPQISWSAIRASSDLFSNLHPQTYGRVYDCVRRVDNLKCVLKQVPLGGLSAKDRAETLNEAQILRSAQSKFVVRYIDSWEDGISDCLYIVMEHAGSDLQLIMKENGGSLCENDVWRYLLPVAEGLQHLHKLRILHRDLKPANIFVSNNISQSQSECVVIGDLGLGKTLATTSDYAKTGVGTPLYFSPELCQEKPYNDKSDVWAFGCLAFELLTGRPPFEARNQLALASKIVNTPTPKLPSNVSTDLQFVIHKCLGKDPLRRPSMTDLLSLSCVQRRLSKLRSSKKAKAKIEDSHERKVLQQQKAELGAKRNELERQQLELEAREQAVAIATDPSEVRKMADRVIALESANAALAARLEDTEHRLADAERGRVVLAGKLEQALASTAASAAATPFKTIYSPGQGKRLRSASESFRASPSKSGGTRLSHPSPVTKNLFFSSTSPVRDVPSRVAPPNHDEEVALDCDEEPVKGPGNSWRELPANDRYGETSGTCSEAEENENMASTFVQPNSASAPPSPIASVAVTQDVSVDVEETVKALAPVNDVTEIPKKAKEKLVARTLQHDASFGSLKSFGKLVARLDYGNCDELNDDYSLFFSADGEVEDELLHIDATAVSLEPSVSTIDSMSVASTPRASVSRSNGFVSDAPVNDDADATSKQSDVTPPQLSLAYTHSVFRPIAPARMMSASRTNQTDSTSASGLTKTKPTAKNSAPGNATRPIARLPAKGGSLFDFSALGMDVDLCTTDSEVLTMDTQTPFTVMHAWRRLRKAKAGDAAPRPLAPSPIGRTSRFWENRACVSVANANANPFVVLFRADQGKTTPMCSVRRAKVRGRRARSDDFTTCAVSDSKLKLQRVDSVAPWQLVEIVPPAGASDKNGPWSELVLEFNSAVSLDEVLVVRGDKRLVEIAERNNKKAKQTERVETENSQMENVDVEPIQTPESVRRWPGLAGEPVRKPSNSVSNSPLKAFGDVLTDKTETKTPPRVGIFTEGQSPDGPLTSVSFTPPKDARKSRSYQSDDDVEKSPPKVAWPLQADQVALLLKRAGTNEDALVLPKVSTSPLASVEPLSPEATNTEKTFPGGYPQKPSFKPEDRALVNDLLYQAQLLQDAVTAAAERLDPGPTRFALTSLASPTNKLGTRPPVSHAFTHLPLGKIRTSRTERRSKVDLLRSIGYMQSPNSPAPDALAMCDSPAMDARGRRLGHLVGDSTETDGDMRVTQTVAKRFMSFELRDDTESSYAGSPAFDESVSMRRKRLEGSLEPVARVLF